MVNVSEFSYGYVVGQLVLAKSDGDDLDRLPDFLGQNAKVTFTRIQGQYVQPVKSVRSGVRALMVSHQPVIAGLMSDGTITGDVDSNAELKPNAKPGLWLVVGQYNVNFGDAFPSTTIEVKESHTEDDPLDIASAIGYKPAPNHVVTTVELPRGGEPGQVYGWTGTGIGWYTPPAGDSAYDLAVRNGFVGSEAEWVQSLKGDPGKPGHWTKDAQAKAQGYWIVVSPTQPESATYTTADGTVVPVIWQKPIEVLVPVIPEAPYFDKYALSIQVASLVGVDYYLTGFTKDGATVDVPDVKIPDGGILKLADVSGKPALPYTVNVEARAEPGFKLPNAFTWGYSVVDPKEVVLLTSETFTGRTAGTSAVGTVTDASLGGAPMTWSGSGTSGTISDTGKYVFAVGSSTLSLNNVGVNQRLEFDLEMPDTYKSAGGVGQYFRISLSNASIFWMHPYEGRSTVKGGPLDLRAPGYVSVVSDYPSRLSGHYMLEFYQRSLIISAPGVAPVTIPLPSDPDPTKKSISFIADSIRDGYVSLDNIKVSRIGF